MFYITFVLVWCYNTTEYFPYKQDAYQKFSVLEKKVIHRIKDFIDYKGLTMRKFDLSISASDGYTQRTLKNEGSVGSDILEKIFHTYPEINPYWLLMGEGGIEQEKRSFSLACDDQEKYPTDYFEKTLLQYLDKPRIKEKIKNLLNDGEGEKNNR